MSAQAAAPPVTAETLEELLGTLASFSAGGPGVTRLVYTAGWCSAQRWLAAEAERRGLRAVVDWAGNLLLLPPAIVPGSAEPVIMVGSHLDSVVSGGRYDGAYGAVAGLLLAAAAAGRPGLPVVGFVTAEEEESRFPGALMGARALLGRVEPGEPERMRDREGVTWREALAVARAAGCAAEGSEATPPLVRPALMLELHIEQGPMLESAGDTLGIVDAVAGYRRFELRLSGEARHSGTTPMTARRDALVAAAEMIIEAETLALANATVATAGRVEAHPGLLNVVPGRCTLGLEVRDANDERLDALVAELVERCRAIAARRRVELEVERVAGLAPVPLSAALGDVAEGLAAERGIRFRRMSSGAAHDAMVFARVDVPSLMVFVPSRGGISHSPDEFTTPEQLLAGFRFADELLGRLAKTPPADDSPGGRRRGALEALNRAPAALASIAFARCCGARAWVDAMVAGRPFQDADDLVERAARFWQHLGPDDQREAFEHHPRIGDLDALRARFESTASWAGAEQAGAAAASDEVLEALARGNEAYESRFGFRFIVCATGLGAEEMLRRLEARMENEADRELAIAAEEQMKITRLRLVKLLDGVA